MQRREKAGIDEARKVPNAFWCMQSITIQKPGGDVYRFLVEDLPMPFGKGHDNFGVIEGGKGVQGSVKDLQEAAQEADDDPFMQMQGRVEFKKVSDRLVYASFYPSGKDFLARFIRRMSVYYDLEKMGFSETRLTMTSVVQVSNPLVKLLGKIIGVRKMMAAQMPEELNTLKRDIEEGRAEEE